jgi:hypothetical protein
LRRSWLIPPAGKSDQDTDADGDGKREQRTMLRLIGNPIESIGTGPGTKPCGFAAKARYLVHGRALAAAETITYAAENWTKHIDNLIAGS